LRWKRKGHGKGVRGRREAAGRRGGPRRSRLARRNRQQTRRWSRGGGTRWRRRGRERTGSAAPAHASPPTARPWWGGVPSARRRAAHRAHAHAGGDTKRRRGSTRPGSLPRTAEWGWAPQQTGRQTPRRQPPCGPASAALPWSRPTVKYPAPRLSRRPPACGGGGGGGERERQAVLPTRGGRGGRDACRPVRGVGWRA